MQESLAKKLRVLRAERGLTIQDAAARVGVRRATLSQIERGRTRPHDATLSKIARAYGVKVEDLITESAEAPTLSLAAMFQQPDEELRHAALEAASPEQLARYLRDLSRAIASAGAEIEMERGSAPAPHVEGLTRYLQHMLDLREEAGTFETAPPGVEEVSLRASTAG